MTPNGQVLTLDGEKVHPAATPAAVGSPLGLGHDGKVPGDPTETHGGASDRQLIARIARAYDSALSRAYCRVRFRIINLNILNLLGLALRDRRKVLDVGCGFGLIGCYFAARFPGLTYHGYDLSPQRVTRARRAAAALGLTNAHFHCQDVRQLALGENFDAVMMVDLLHHLDDPAKEELVATCTRHLTPDGRLLVKEIATRPHAKVGFTWFMDVLVTGGFDMWYRDERWFRSLFGRHFRQVETFAVSDLLPYPHVLYACDGVRGGAGAAREFPGREVRQ